MVYNRSLASVRVQNKVEILKKKTRKTKTTTGKGFGNAQASLLRRTHLPARMHHTIKLRAGHNAPRTYGFRLQFPRFVALSFIFFFDPQAANFFLSPPFQFS